MNNNDTLVGRVICKTKMECALLQTFLAMKGAAWTLGGSLATIYYYDYNFSQIIYIIDKLHHVKWSTIINNDEISFGEYMARNRMVFGALAKLKDKINWRLPT